MPTMAQNGADVTSNGDGAYLHRPLSFHALTRMRLLVLTLLLAGTASAQDTILTPGHPDLDFGDLTIEASTIYNLQIMEPEHQSLGFITETATREGNVLTVVTSADVAMAGPLQVDSTRMSWPTLAPLSHDMMREDARGTVAFSSDQISGAFNNGNAEFPFQFDDPDAVFPLAAIPYVVRALPLDQTGYEAMLPVFSAESRFKEALITIVGPETVAVNGTTINAIAVDQVGGGGLNQGFRLRHYVDPATRDLVHSVIYPPNMEVHWVQLTEQEYADVRAAEAAEMAAAAANAITPGSGALVAISPQTVTMDVLLVEPQQQNLGTIAITETIEDGRLTFTTDVQIPAAGQTQQDTTVVMYPSLIPVSRVEVKPGEVERATFGNGRMTGTVTEGEETRTVEADLGGAFGPGATNLIIRSLPFAEGYVSSFSQIDGDGDVSTSQLRVTGQDTYTTPSGTERTVWTVIEIEEGAPDYTYLVDAETRELLKIEFSPQPGVTVAFVTP